MERITRQFGTLTTTKLAHFSFVNEPVIEVLNLQNAGLILYLESAKNSNFQTCARKFLFCFFIYTDLLILRVYRHSFLKEIFVRAHSPKL